MTDIDLRHYDQDKDYEKAVNAFLKGEELTLDCEFEKDSLEKLREMCTIPDDIKEKLVDIYNYMAINKNSRIEFRFDIGIKFVCEIDDSEWKSLPRVNLDDVEFVSSPAMMAEMNRQYAHNLVWGKKGDKE